MNRICSICGMDTEDRVCPFCSKLLKRKENLERTLVEVNSDMDFFTITLRPDRYVKAIDNYLYIRNTLQHKIILIDKMLTRRYFYGLEVKRERMDRILLGVKFKILKSIS